MRHTHENYWELVGRPKKFSKLENGQANSFTSQERDMDPTFNKSKTVDTSITSSGDSSCKMVTVPEDEFENLCRFTAQLEGLMIMSYPPISSFASIESGTHATAFHVSSSSLSSWIIDSGALDYMIVYHHYFPLILFVLVMTKLKWQMEHCPPFLGKVVSTSYQLCLLLTYCPLAESLGIYIAQSLSFYLTMFFRT